MTRGPVMDRGELLLAGAFAASAALLQHPTAHSHLIVRAFGNGHDFSVGMSWEQCVNFGRPCIASPQVAATATLTRFAGLWSLAEGGSSKRASRAAVASALPHPGRAASAGELQHGPAADLLARKIASRF